MWAEKNPEKEVVGLRVIRELLARVNDMEMVSSGSLRREGPTPNSWNIGEGEKEKGI